MGCTSSKSSTDSKEKRTAAERKAAWISVQQRIPVKKTAEDKQRRIDLFKKFDTNDTGSLTLSEVYNGCVNELELDQFTSRLYDIVKRSFDKSKSMGNREANAGSEDRVEFLEFRLMLSYIYNYFELWVMFDEIDTSGNMLIDEAEFKKAAPMLEQWGLTMNDPEAVFKTLDGNGSGTVTFDEFAAWATAMKLDADGDPDNL